MGPNWNWVEKRYQDSGKPTGSEYYNSDTEKDLGLAFNLTNTLENGFLSKNARNGSNKIVNWMIKNDGKQTIIVF